jgi:hypothetical protein
MRCCGPAALNGGLSGSLGPGGILILPLDSEFSFNFGDAGLEAELDLGYSLAFSEMACVIEVPQICAQFVQELAGKAVSHRLSILPQKGCSWERFDGWGTWRRGLKSCDDLAWRMFSA